MSQVITDAFSSYWQQCLIDQTPVVLDEFVLAHIPGLDPDAPIDPASGLPPAEQIVHRHTVDQRGRINNDAVAYSIVMDTTVGDFTFNAMYLINTAQNIVGMIVHKGEETKLRTDPAIGQTGNSLVKSMLMEYDRAAEASQTVIDASTWQIDYAARLRGMDEDLRRQAMGTFGHAAFYGDGFKLVNNAGLYKVQPGQGYVGGLLVELATEQEVIPGAKPVGLWLDVYRAGSLLSPWVNHVTLTLSTTDLVDYVDANGYPHFVTKLAVINADDSVTDTRAKRTITLTGDVTGKAIFNGPDSIELEVHVEDNSHGHTIENVDGLQGALDGKSPTGHTHTPGEAGAAPVEHGHEIADVSGLQLALDDKSPTGHTHTPEQAGAAPFEHGHEIADVSGLQVALDGKSPTGHTHTPEQANALPVHTFSSISHQPFRVTYTNTTWLPMMVSCNTTGLGYDTNSLVDMSIALDAGTTPVFLSIKKDSSGEYNDLQKGSGSCMVPPGSTFTVNAHDAILGISTTFASIPFSIASMRLYVNPATFGDDGVIRAFTSDEERDEWAPAYSVEVPAIPDDWSHERYELIDGVWVIRPEWLAMVEVKEAEGRRARMMANATVQARHFTMMSDTAQANAWRAHYQELYALEQLPEWPLAPQWPTAPALAA